MSSTYSHIAIATDFSETADRAVRIGGRLAQRFGSKVSLLHVFDPSPYVSLLEPRNPGEAEETMAGAARKELSKSREALLTDVENVELVPLRHDSPAAGLGDWADENGVDLIVVGTRGRSGIVRMLVGSVAERIVRYASCDVMVVGTADDEWSPELLVAPTDFSMTANKGLEAASMLQKNLSAKLSLVHVYDDTVPIPSSSGKLESADEVAGQLKAELDTLRKAHFGEADVEVNVMAGANPAHVICKHAEKSDADLIVISTHGRTGLAHMFIGSVAEKVVRHAPCPVLAIRATPPEEAADEG